jgi:hypothetical protein
MPAPTIDAYTAALPAPLREIATALRGLIDGELGPGTVWHGHPIWKNGMAPVAGFKAYSAYVTFMIWHAESLTGLSHAANGIGSIKIRTADEIDHAAITAWLRAVRTNP